MPKNEAETRYELIDPVLREKGYRTPYIRLETPAPVDPIGPKGRRRAGSGRTDYLICVEVPHGTAPLPVAVLEAKKEDEDPLKGMQQAKDYSECKRFDAKYIFSTNGHRYAKFNKFSGEYTGPFPFGDFPDHARLTACYHRHTGIKLDDPSSNLLFQPDSPAYPESRYYQDAAIRAAFEKILKSDSQGEAPRVLLALATGSGKTIIAANLLWRLHEAERLPKPALFLCDRDELREQAYTKLKAVFGDNARIVKTERGENAAKNARIHIATYQTLGLDDDSGEFASFLTDFYPADAFSVIIIDECHRSAWGKWSEVLKRNPAAIHIGLTATPRQLRETATEDDAEITANNHRYFGDPVYEYTLIQAQEDGYLAACEIIKRKPTIDARVFTKAEVLAARPTNIKTGQPITEEDLTKDEYTGKDFDDELFIDMRTPAMCDDLFNLLCRNGGPEQKVIIFLHPRDSRRPRRDADEQPLRPLVPGKQPRAQRPLCLQVHGRRKQRRGHDRADARLRRTRLHCLHRGPARGRRGHRAAQRRRLLPLPQVRHQVLPDGRPRHPHSRGHAEVQILALRLHGRHRPVRHGLPHQPDA